MLYYHVYYFAINNDNHNELLCELIFKYVYGFTKIKRVSLLFVKQIDDNVVTSVINW